MQGMARKQNGSKRERLLGLLAQARHYAEWNLRNHGQIPPCAMALNKDGIMMMVPPRMGTVQDKDQFADAARMLAVGYGAEAVCMILESWAVFGSRPGQNIADIPPSQSAERVEVEVVSAEIKGIAAQQIFTIKRDAAGLFVELEEKLTPKFDEMQGRFARILPPKEPTENQAKMASFVVAGLGYVVEGKGKNPIWN
jgi:hypothetical protein